MSRLASLLSRLDPHLRRGVYVFATVPAGAVPALEPVMTFEEDEGRTLVLREEDAHRAGLSAEYPCAWITLRVDSGLADVGLLARVTTALAAGGISVNPVSALRHDHLFVPHERAAEAMAVLEALRGGGTPRVTPLGEFELDEDPARVDRDVVWGFLSTQAYWARWRARADVETQLDRAWRVVGAYRRSSGEMVGFARGVSDGVSFGYLADVFVLPQARGAGLGQAIVAAITDQPRVRWVLFTADAHAMYERFGFGAPDATCMVLPARM